MIMIKLTKKAHFENYIYNQGDDKADNLKNNVLPVVYSPQYSVKFFGIQKLHPFEAAKGQHILQLLITDNFFQFYSFYGPKEISKKELLKVHTKKYINSLKWSYNVAKITEIPLLHFFPNYFVQRGYLRPMRFQTAGSILAGKLALQEGWSINLGGGFHHCCSYQGGGFCPYADVTLMIRRILENEDNDCKNIMIIDLDAHQGNGHERDFLNDSNVYILDMYNFAIYPRDNPAKLAIRCPVELKPRTEDAVYLRKLKKSLKKSFSEFVPDLVVYVAGTDILKNDPLGLLNISPEGVVQRDQIVFSTAITQNIPIVMLLSGGYLKSSAQVIADSIINLKEKGLLQMKM